MREAVRGLLSAAGISDPQVDADLLIGFVLDASRGRVQAMAITDTAVSPDDAATINELTTRRAAREPLQHITGQAPFRSLVLAVGPGVFVPRPETEQVTQIAIDRLNQSELPEPIAVDLGTGSGAIALALATEVPRARVFAVEKSVDAFLWTRRNFDAVAAPNATLVLGDLADAFPEIDGTADVVISNPPYIPDAAIPREVEVRLHDPGAALYGGEDGLDVVRAVSTRAQMLLHPGGTLILEHGEEQGPGIRALLAADGWRTPRTTPDLSGRDRATSAIR
ncbi:peptide chain release factor N(5)-glutamine methyltransferase [Homoserinimonas sp. OAct 916]|uniref:peptide chain release factor N(5)-glutamine methyltransferase n=1 Tax=Homoserinimonas sp. OAct 916 TaxID=2211450 RepID=UPI001E4C75A1|nr:peptide chain release factor N(5)-glutamine methyltransferase [Homoserinimonas sp. OAct 916]